MSEWTKISDGRPDQKHSRYWVVWEHEGKRYVVLSEWDGYEFCRVQPSYEYQIIDEYAVDSFGGEITHFMPVEPPGLPESGTEDSARNSNGIMDDMEGEG